MMNDIKRSIDALKTPKYQRTHQQRADAIWLIAVTACLIGIAVLVSLKYWR